MKHDPNKGIDGTDLTQEMVDFVEETDGLLLDQATFNPSNPTYVVNPVIDSGPTPPQTTSGPNKRETYQLLDPSEVMWTSTTYAEDSDQDDLSCIEEEDEQEDSSEESEDVESEDSERRRRIWRRRR